MHMLFIALVSIGMPKMPKANPEDITKFVAKVDTATTGAKTLISGTLENLSALGTTLMDLESVGADQKEALKATNEKALGALEHLKAVDLAEPDSLAAALKDGKSVASEYLALITANLSAEGAASAVADKKQAVESFLQGAVTQAKDVATKATEAVSLAPGAAKAKTMGAAKGLAYKSMAGKQLDEAGITKVVDKGAGFAKDMGSLATEAGDLIKAYQKALSELK